MKIAVIGGSGFVGSRLIDLLKSTHQITNIDKRESPFFNDITIIGNVWDVELLTKQLSGGYDAVVLLAAEHRDDVSPVSLYYDVNVEGARNVLSAMDANGIKTIVFTSSVAVYGLNKVNPDENHPSDPFNHYGKSKWQAEEVLRAWQAVGDGKTLNILRPTVIFGERNRGNVYNLLKQISGGAFRMIGRGENKKSMSYVGNIVAFIEFLLANKKGYNVYNYVDTPDFTMNELVDHVGKVLNKHIPSTHFPYWLGMMAGYGFDCLAFVTRKKMTISSVRVKKFCATTQFNASAAVDSSFKAPFTLGQGLERTLEYEFVHPQPDNITFISE